MDFEDWSDKDTPLEAAIKQTVSGIDVMNWHELADTVLELKDALAECNATCEGLDSYAAVCVANVQRLEAELKIRNRYTKPPNDFGDDISTELAIQCNELSSRIRELELLYNNSKTSAEFFKLALEETNAVNERLEAERDRLKAEVKDLRYSLDNIEGDERYSNLRARHAALVEKANHAYSEWEGGSHREAIAAMEELKAALAEVK